MRGVCNTFICRVTLYFLMTIIIVIIVIKLTTINIAITVIIVILEKLLIIGDYRNHNIYYYLIKQK